MDWLRVSAAIRQGCVDPFCASLYPGKDSPSPPPAPDYSAAAQSQGAANTQAAIVQNYLNRPQENTPYGSRKWTQTGSYQVPAYGDQPAATLPQWTSSIELTPEGQKLADQQMRMSSTYGDIGEAGLGRIQQSFSSPLSVGNVNELQDKAYQAQTSRLDPQWQMREEQERTRLANQGLSPGGEAYSNAMRDFSSARNDAYQQARLAAASQAPALLQQELAIRNQPLTEVNALRTGSQPSIPQFQPFSTASVGAAPVMQGAMAQGQAAQNAYNSQVAQDNSMMSGLFGIGGSIAGSLPWGTWMSDRRLKRDIKKVGEHPKGFGIYEFRYLWDDQFMTGVMADEVEAVLPDAVVEIDGYKAVNYGALHV